MKALLAQVSGGRLVLDEPTRLPEGEEADLIPLDEVPVSGGHCLDDLERERPHQGIDRGTDDGRSGWTSDACQVVVELRARPVCR